MTAERRAGLAATIALPLHRCLSVHLFGGHLDVRLESSARAGTIPVVLASHWRLRAPTNSPPLPPVGALLPSQPLSSAVLLRGICDVYFGKFAGRRIDRVARLSMLEL
jgi:hypothetical protein